jgi:hypothetical protein
LQIEIESILKWKAHQFAVGLCFVRAEIFSENPSDASARGAI